MITNDELVQILLKRCDNIFHISGNLYSYKSTFNVINSSGTTLFLWCIDRPSMPIVEFRLNNTELTDLIKSDIWIECGKIKVTTGMRIW